MPEFLAAGRSDRHRTNIPADCNHWNRRYRRTAGEKRKGGPPLLAATARSAREKIVVRCCFESNSGLLSSLRSGVAFTIAVASDFYPTGWAVEGEYLVRFEQRSKN